MNGALHGKKAYLDVDLAEPRNVRNKRVLLRGLLDVNRKPHVVASLLCPLVERPLCGT